MALPISFRHEYKMDKRTKDNGNPPPHHPGRKPNPWYHALTPGVVATRIGSPSMFLCFCSPSLTQAIVDSLAIDCGLLIGDSPLGLRKHKICSATAVQTAEQGGMLAVSTVFLKSPGHGAMSKTPLTNWVLAPVPDIFLLAALSMVNAQHWRHLIRRVGWDG